jgi:hypothetical protein
MLTGTHKIKWDIHKKGQHVPAGIYIVRLQTDTGSISRKLAVTD